jgi:hypothetical protein
MFIKNFRTSSTRSNKRTVLASSASASGSQDETDFGYHQFDLVTLLDRLISDIGCIALFSGKELELLAELDPDDFKHKYDLEFLRRIQAAADQHLEEKRQIRDAFGLLKIYHKSSTSAASTGGGSGAKPKTATTSTTTETASPTKRRRNKK